MLSRSSFNEEDPSSLTMVEIIDSNDRNCNFFQVDYKLLERDMPGSFKCFRQK
jgi:hypothetical protein